MSTYRNALPQLSGRPFLTDGGIETTMIFHHGFELPEFATFVLLDDAAGLDALRDYYRRYLDIAASAGTGFILETVTWRASRDWGAKLGYTREQLADINRRAVDLADSLRDEYTASGLPNVISGNIGPRGDGYVVGEQMSAAEAAEYHSEQIATFAATQADMVTAMTMTHVEEAMGIVTAAAAQGLPAVIGFTTETDGRLPSGMSLREAIETVDAGTGGGPAYYMINCAHPDHFDHALDAGQAWTQRIRAVRANASRLSHAELDEAEELDAGDPHEFGRLHAGLRERFSRLSVFGGCCGTDDRHIGAICQGLS